VPPRRNNPEDTILHSHRREDLKSYTSAPHSGTRQVLVDICTLHSVPGWALVLRLDSAV
jgi:hypothetical protein